MMRKQLSSSLFLTPGLESD